MIQREYLPATMKMELWQKDMQVIGDMARAARCPTPLLNACSAVYTAAMAQDLGEHDTAAVAEVLAPASLAAPSGVRRPGRAALPRSA
jgi:3-hydroxyisobutyrate dehydrogenase-like beta-hydroxyacid dehydrogenase